VSVSPATRRKKQDADGLQPDDLVGKEYVARKTGMSERWVIEKWMYSESGIAPMRIGEPPRNPAIKDNRPCRWFKGEIDDYVARLHLARLRESAIR
jgi:hypothetical protein